MDSSPVGFGFKPQMQAHDAKPVKSDLIDAILSRFGGVPPDSPFSPTPTHLSEINATLIHDDATGREVKEPKTKDDSSKGSLLKLAQSRQQATRFPVQSSTTSTQAERTTRENESISTQSTLRERRAQIMRDRSARVAAHGSRAFSISKSKDVDSIPEVGSGSSSVLHTRTHSSSDLTDLMRNMFLTNNDNTLEDEVSSFQQRNKSGRGTHRRDQLHVSISNLSAIITETVIEPSTPSTPPVLAEREPKKEIKKEESKPKKDVKADTDVFSPSNQQKVQTLIRERTISASAALKENHIGAKDAWQALKTDKLAVAFKYWRNSKDNLVDKQKKLLNFIKEISTDKNKKDQGVPELIEVLQKIQLTQEQIRDLRWVFIKNSNFLDKLMNSSLLFEIFSNISLKFFSSENILFLKDVSKYKQIKAESEKEKAFNDIKRRYINDEARNQINISADEKEAIMAATVPSATIFDKAAKAIEDLINSDFQQTHPKIEPVLNDLIELLI